MAWNFGKKKKSTSAPTYSTYGSNKKKKTFGQRMTSLKGTAKKAFLLAVAGTALVGGPGYYYYGTTHEQEVKVISVDNNWVRWDSDKQEPVYDYKITTDHGVLENKDTYMHVKFDSKELQDQFKEGKIYRVKTYGERFNLPFGMHDFYPNVLSAHEVTPAEQKARAEAAAKAQQKEAQAQGVQQQGAVVTPQANATAPVVVQQQPVLSGSMITYEVVADGERVQMTVPVEAAGKITINKVSPLVPQVVQQQPKPPGS
ncbi:MAG: hypothetical protein GC185_12350 [Alphaproteobacteria bacterium]|nr:hypothetical protein [Alphaproteobacteria bacterium]